VTDEPIFIETTPTQPTREELAAIVNVRDLLTVIADLTRVVADLERQNKQLREAVAALMRV
jgi:hypothetical protein